METDFSAINRRLVFYLLWSAGISFLLLGILLRGLTGAVDRRLGQPALIYRLEFQPVRKS